MTDSEDSTQSKKIDKKQKKPKNKIWYKLLEPVCAELVQVPP